MYPQSRWRHLNDERQKKPLESRQFLKSLRCKHIICIWLLMDRFLSKDRLNTSFLPRINQALLDFGTMLCVFSWNKDKTHVIYTLKIIVFGIQFLLQDILRSGFHYHFNISRVTNRVAIICMGSLQF